MRQPDYVSSIFAVIWPLAGVKKVENLAGALGRDAGNLAEVAYGGPLDLFQRSEMVQECPLAGWADPGISCNPASRMSFLRSVGAIR